MALIVNKKETTQIESSLFYWLIISSIDISCERKPLNRIFWIIGVNCNSFGLRAGAVLRIK